MDGYEKVHESTSILCVIGLKLVLKSKCGNRMYHPIMKIKYLIISSIIISGSLIARSDFRIDPEVMLLDEIPKEEIPLKVSGTYRIKVEAVEGNKSDEEKRPNFEISNPFDRTEIYSLRDCEKVQGGWLIALDAGEWGSWLGWYSESGADHYKISSFRVFDFVRFYGQLYIYGGGCGGNAGEYGFLAKVSRESDIWILENIEMFPNCVLAVSETQVFDRNQDPDFLVLTPSLIYQWSKVNGKKLLHGYFGWRDPDRGTWRYQNPNSIAKDYNDNFFIGTDHGIIAILKNRESREFPMGLKKSPSTVGKDESNHNKPEVATP